MVKYNTILKVIEEEVIKCRTLAEIREILSNIDSRERYAQLVLQNLLNPIEQREYERARHILEDGEDVWNDEEIEGAKETTFYYERRIVEGINRNPVPQVETDRFIEDNQIGFSTENGMFESRQIKDENKYINVDTISRKKLMTVDEYFDGAMEDINYQISNQGYLNKVDDEYRKYIKDLDYVIGKSNGLVENVILYRGGHLDDIHLNVGDHGKFKRFTSTSFQRAVAEKWQEGLSTDFLYKIYAPKGTKGLCGNGMVFSNDYVDEHEYLLGRNTGYTVLNIDYDNNIIEVVLDDPNEQ